MAIYSTLRIIGGRFKGMRLSILDVPGLRPTPDRLREDLFNLLGSKVQGARVLDLFAGTGVLGLEAISRGAYSLTMVEINRDDYLNLCNAKRHFKDAGEITAVNADALKFLDKCQEKFDLIFLDPPYKSNLLSPSLKLIAEHDLLADDGVVYAEAPAGSQSVFPFFEVVQQRSSGQVSFYLLKKSSLLDF